MEQRKIERGKKLVQSWKIDYDIAVILLHERRICRVLQQIDVLNLRGQDVWQRLAVMLTRNSAVAKISELKKTRNTIAMAGAAAAADKACGQ